MSTATLDRTGEPQRIWDEGDPDIPAEFHELLVRMLSYHVENSARRLFPTTTL